MIENDSPEIISPDQNYNGMSYGDWAARWTNWLFSELPERDEVQRDVVFLRGNVEYRREVKKENGDGKLVDPWKFFYNRTGEASIVISDDIPVFVPVLTSTQVFGGGSESGTMFTEEQVRRIARIDNDQSGAVWANIQSSGDKREKPLLSAKDGEEQKKLRMYRITSRVFKLSISERNPYWSYVFQYPINPGEFDAVTDGFFLLIKSLPIGSHRIRFGGKGRIDYRTDSIYDLHVTPQFRPVSTVTDISKEPDEYSIISTKGSKGKPDRSNDIDELRTFKNIKELRTYKTLFP